ncbi:hypothetical protein LSM04_000631 [Trypanosoma melophagium]|uniref:uncharacterized protein n=1 Tax=Trypanosoma melophagium TaxID=715481 RepID=UPI00351A8B34|nr:hypothetical protein LSM04_000631 [Trypanosoma melophagium]
MRSEQRRQNSAVELNRPTGLTQVKSFGGFQNRRRSSVASLPNRSRTVMHDCQSGHQEEHGRGSSRGTAYSDAVQAEPRRRSSIGSPGLLQSDEIRAIGAVELGMLIPGSVTLMKLHLPLPQENYPFNLHERPGPFIPGDAVSLQMGQNSVKIMYARTEDMLAVYAAAGIKQKSKLLIRDDARIGDVKYHHVQRITCGYFTADPRFLVVRLTGNAGLVAHICFSDKALCTAFIKILMSRSPAHVELLDDGIFSNCPRESVSASPRRSSILSSHRPSLSQNRNIEHATAFAGTETED